MTINAKTFNLDITPSSDGKRYSQYPNGDYPSVGISLVVRSMDQTAGDGGTITIPRYATVHFDLSGSTAATLDTPFVQLLAHHDYGYATPGTPGQHTQSGADRGNDVGGLIRAHTYLTAGTYEYTVRVKVPSGGYSEASCTIIVQEPSDYFTNVVAISSGGAWPTWASDTLYTMADNLDCTGKGNLNIATGNPGVNNVWIMGNPSAPAVVSGSVTVGRNNPGSASISESYCLGFIGITGATDIGVDYGRAINFYAVDGVKIYNAVGNHYGTYGGTNFKRPSQISFSRCDVLSNNDYYPYYSQQGDEYCALLDCSIEMQSDATLGSGIHVARSAATYHSVFAHNKFFGLSLEGAYLSIRTRGRVEWERVYDATDTVLTDGVVVADNIFGDATDVYTSALPTSAMPSNSGNDAVIRNVVWISNDYVRDSSGATELRFAGKNLGVMNCPDLIASEIEYKDEVIAPNPYSAMSHTDFYPVYSEHGFDQGYLANERIQLPAFEDPGKAGT